MLEPACAQHAVVVVQGGHWTRLWGLWWGLTVHTEMIIHSDPQLLI